MNVIRFGLKQKLDVSIYAAPEFNDMQMNQIRAGLFEGIKVSVYAKPEIDSQEMMQIRVELLRKKMNYEKTI